MEDMRHSPMSLESAAQPREPAVSHRSAHLHEGRTRGRREEARIEQLVRTIEGEVVPRMLLAHRSTLKGTHARPENHAPTEGEIQELARLVLAHDASVALSYVTAMRTEGTPLDTLLLDLMGPAARYLGLLWEEDLCDFTDVTIGLVRLHQVLRQLGVGERRDPAGNELHRILLLPVPEEQHSFGLVMVAEFFRRAGWAVREESFCTAADLAAIVAAEHFDIVGFSVSCDNRLDVLCASIRMVRSASCNRHIGSMVGGRVFVERPELVAKVGADAMAMDGKRAVQQAQQLVELLTLRSH